MSPERSITAAVEEHTRLEERPTGKESAGSSSPSRDCGPYGISRLWFHDFWKCLFLGSEAGNHITPTRNRLLRVGPLETQTHTAPHSLSPTRPHSFIFFTRAYVAKLLQKQGRRKKMIRLFSFVALAGLGR